MRRAVRTRRSRCVAIHDECRVVVTFERPVGVTHVLPRRVEVSDDWHDERNTLGKLEPAIGLEPMTC